MYQAQERLYLSRDGRIVREGDPDAHQLFVAKGGYVPFQLAKKYGLGERDAAQEPVATAAEHSEPEAAAHERSDMEVAARLSPPATTARKGPKATKKAGMA